MWSLFPFIRQLLRYRSELTKAGYSRGAAVSQRVINYPDSFGAARALLSIKVASRTRQFPSRRLLQRRSRYELWLFCSPRSAVCEKKLNRMKGDRPIIASARERIKPMSILSKYQQRIDTIRVQYFVSRGTEGTLEAY